PLGGDVVPVEENLPRRGNEELRQQVEERRLAGPVRTDQRVDLATAHPQIDVVDCDESLEFLDEALCLQDVIVFGHRAPVFCTDGAAVPPPSSADYGQCRPAQQSG